MALELWQLVITGTVNDNYFNNVLHLDVNNAGPSPEDVVANNIASTMFPAPDEALIGSFAAAMGVTTIMKSMRIRRLSPAGHTWVFPLLDDSEFIPGTRTGGATPSQLAGGIKFYTDVANKIGKIFVPGLSETDITGDVMSGGLVGALQNLGDFWKVGGVLITSGYAWTGVVPHRSPEGVYTWEGITYVAIPNRVWDQGRRRYPE